MFVLFAWDTYYPSGGMNDYVGHYMSTEAAMGAFMKTDYSNYQIVSGMEVIESGSRYD